MKKGGCYDILGLDGRTHGLVAKEKKMGRGDEFGGSETDLADSNKGLAPERYERLRVTGKEMYLLVKKYEEGIRAHRDARGDDRCWMDDEELYKLLPEGFEPPLRDSSVELERCKQFITCRHNPSTEYVSPEREIESLKDDIKERDERIDRLIATVRRQIDQYTRAIKR